MVAVLMISFYIRSIQRGVEITLYPKKWIKVNAGIILTDEQCAKKIESAKRMTEQRMS